MAHPVSANVGNTQAAVVQQNPAEASSFWIKSFGPRFEGMINVEKPRDSVTIRDIRIASANTLNIPIESIQVIISGKLRDDNDLIPPKYECINIINIYNF